MRREAGKPDIPGDNRWWAVLAAQAAWSLPTGKVCYLRDQERAGRFLWASHSGAEFSIFFASPLPDSLR